MKKLLLLLSLPFLLIGAESTYETILDTSNLTIANPTLQERQTAKIRLSNGIEAYLISDPGVEQSSAALAVNVGSWSDPDEYPGMAHFLEHMLFMGTQAYPKEAEYHQYMSDHGGKVNAYTSTDRTVYVFSINNDAFSGGLDRFSHFFIDPLFNQASIERELHAVDQEHAKNVEHDGWRQWMIFKETSNPNHPIVKFSTGNANTLRGIPQSAMKRWYAEHYSAEKMHLVVLSALPIDELIQMTVNDFSSVPVRPSKETVELPANMTTENQKGHFIYIEPVKDINILSLTWELSPTLADDPNTHVGQLLSYVLKNGAKNGLLGKLKKEHLAFSVRANEEALSKEHKTFTIDVELTENGVEQIDQVITYTFEALARLKKTGIPEYIFKEVKDIAEIQYTYQSRKDPFEYVMQTSHLLVDESLETFPKNTLIPTQYDPTKISLYLDHLTPENCIYFVTANFEKTKVRETAKEKWMAAKYSVQPVAPKELLSWSRASINPQIGLPPPNPFIPKNFEIVATTPSEKSPVPQLLQENDQGKVYFATDEKYLTPEVAYLFRLKSPALDGSAKSKALADLYIQALGDAIFPTISAAETVGTKIGMKEENFAFAISINGFSDGQDRLLVRFFRGMKKLRPSREQFALYKNALFSSYENTEKELPVLQSLQILSNVLFNDSPTAKEKHKALQNISYEEFTAFAKSITKKAYLDSLLYGNLTRDEANKLIVKIKGTLRASPFSISEQNKRQILTLENNQGPYMVVEPTTMQGNAAVLMIEEGKYTFEDRAAQQILGKVVGDSFFDTLRTKQQTGYIARAWEKEEEKQLVHYFAVQSSTHKPLELISRFELFLENFLKQFTTRLPEDRFERVRNMSIKTLNVPPENLATMGARLFLLGFDYGGDFTLVDKRIEALRKITYGEVRSAAQTFFSRKNSKRIAVLMEGLTPEEQSFSYELITPTELRDQGTYIAWEQ